MRERGYPADFAAALTVASAVVGPIIPPSVGLVVYAFLSGTSVARLFLAGLVPGVLVGISLMIFNRIYAIRYDVPVEPRATFRQVLVAAQGRPDGFGGTWNYPDGNHYRLHHGDRGRRAGLRLRSPDRRRLSAIALARRMEGARRHDGDDLGRHDHHRLFDGHGLAACHRAGATKAGCGHALVDGQPVRIPGSADRVLSHHRLLRRGRASQVDPGADAIAADRFIRHRPYAFRHHRAAGAVDRHCHAADGHRPLRDLGGGARAVRAGHDRNPADVRFRSS